MTTLAPPPLTPAPQPPEPPRTSARAVSIIAMVVGAIVILGTVTTAALSTAFSGLRTTSYSVDASGVDTLDVQLQAGSLRIEFADIPEAKLDVQTSAARGQWTLRTDGSRLVVASPQNRVGWPNLFGMADEALLQLPRNLEGATTTLDVAAGALTASGRFGDLDVDVQAGSATIDGSTGSLVAKTSAGSTHLDLSAVHTANLDVEAGTMTAILRGSQPAHTSMKVGAGSLDVAVPTGSYDVTSNVSAGSFDNRVGSQPGADSTVRVEVSVGQATLRASD